MFEAPSDYVKRCFAEYGLMTDPSGRYAALYKPYHLIGLELGISVASAGLRGEPTGAPTGFRADVVATAKRDLAAGEMLDGEGGFTVWGRLMPAEDSLRLGGLPIGLAHHLRLAHPVKAGRFAGAMSRWRRRATRCASAARWSRLSHRRPPRRRSAIAPAQLAD